MNSQAFNNETQTGITAELALWMHNKLFTTVMLTGKHVKSFADRQVMITQMDTVH